MQTGLEVAICLPSPDTAEPESLSAVNHMSLFVRHKVNGMASSLQCFTLGYFDSSRPSCCKQKDHVSNLIEPEMHSIGVSETWGSLSHNVMTILGFNSGKVIRRAFDLEGKLERRVTWEWAIIT